MKKFMMICFGVLPIFVLLFQTSLSQTISVSFLHGTMIAGPKYQIEVYAQASAGAPKMGTSSIAVQYNTGAFGTNVTSALTPANFSGGNYLVMAMTNLFSNTKSLNIELLVPGSGTVISSTSPGTKIATLEMNVADVSQGSTIQLDIANSPIYADDEATPFTVVPGDNSSLHVRHSDDGHVIPQDYALENNFPNPFNPQTIIQYSLPERAQVKLIIYDILGKEVASLVNEVQNPGNYEVIFPGSNLSSGVYFYRMTAQAQGNNAFAQVRKMILLK